MIGLALTRREVLYRTENISANLAQNGIQSIFIHDAFDENAACRVFAENSDGSVDVTIEYGYIPDLASVCKMWMVKDNNSNQVWYFDHHNVVLNFCIQMLKQDEE